jgi:hypothetical protein
MHVNSPEVAFGEIILQLADDLWLAAVISASAASR